MGKRFYWLGWRCLYCNMEGNLLLFSKKEKVQLFIMLFVGTYIGDVQVDEDGIVLL